MSYVIVALLALLLHEIRAERRHRANLAALRFAADVRRSQQMQQDPRYPKPREHSKRVGAK